jgi:hypothetical protein
MWVVLGLVLLAAPERVLATAISLGTLSFESSIIGAGNRFVIGNFTEALSAPPDFPVQTPLTFVNAVLVLTHQITGDESIPLGNLGPGQHSTVDYLVDLAFTQARFTATLLAPVFELVGGGLFVPSTTTITADLLPADGVLVPDEAFVSLDIEGTLVQPTPEPATFVVVIAGAGALALARRRGLRRRYD